MVSLIYLQFIFFLVICSMTLGQFVWYFCWLYGYRAVLSALSTRYLRLLILLILIIIRHFSLSHRQLRWYFRLICCWGRHRPIRFGCTCWWWNISKELFLVSGNTHHWVRQQQNLLRFVPSFRPVLDWDQNLRILTIIQGKIHL